MITKNFEDTVSFKNCKHPAVFKMARVMDVLNATLHACGQPEFDEQFV